jgi:dCMP deaminase
MRISLDEMYIEIADTMAKRSTCVRKQVGAVLVRDGKIISCGYNGVASGQKHCEKHWHDHCNDHNINYKEFINTKEFFQLHGEFSRQNEIHAEINALIYVSRDQSKDCTLYTTLSPCSDCAKVITQSGVKRVVYKEEYDRDTGGIDLLKKLGIECVKMKANT